MTEDEIVGWHLQLNGHESEQTLGDSEGQGSLMCCNLWDCRVGHNSATEQQIIRAPSISVQLSLWSCGPHRFFCFINYAKAFDYLDYYKLWKILKEMGIPEYLTCLLRNLYGQVATVKIGQGTTDWFQIGKGVHQVCIITPLI